MEAKVTFFTTLQAHQLFENAEPDFTGKDLYPVSVLVFPATSSGVWYLTEIREAYMAYGLYMPYGGKSVLQEFDLDKLAHETRNDVKLHFDANFVARYPLSVYMKAANHDEGYSDLFWTKEYLLEKMICTKEEILSYPDRKKTKAMLRPFHMPNRDW